MPKDVEEIHRLIQPFAERNLMLPRSIAYLFAHVGEYWVAEQEGRIVGCVALRPMGHNGDGAPLAEIVSLAVAEAAQGQGLGRRLVEVALQAARERGFHHVFTLTLIPAFFQRLGFQRVENVLQRLPMKVWGECIYCPKQTHCDEVALWIDLSPEKEAR